MPHLLRTLRGHSGWVQGVDADFTKMLAVSASDDKTLALWNIAGGSFFALPPGYGCPAGGFVTSPRVCEVAVAKLGFAAEGAGVSPSSHTGQPLGCWASWASPSGQYGFNQGASAGQTHPGSAAVCAACPRTEVVFDDEEPHCPVDRLCACPFGDAARHGCTYDGQLKCIIVPATPVELGKLLHTMDP